MTDSEILTSGMVGKTVRLLFDESWTALSKIAVFRAGDICKAVACDAAELVIPEEVLRQPFRKLYVGVSGTDETGTLVIPTIMAEGPMIRYGADPTEDSGNGNLPVWKILKEQIGYLEKLKTDDKSSLVAAINELHDTQAPDTGNSNGLSSKAVELLIQILRAAVYTEDQSAAIGTLYLNLTAGMNQGDIPTTTPSTPSGPQNPGGEVTLTHISAVYTGGSVPEGTPVTELTGITVTGHYSNGASVTLSGYTLSGTIGAGENTITVTIGALSTTVTVTGIAAASNEPGNEPPESNLLYAWDFTRSMTDSVTGKELTATEAVRDAEGLHFTATNSSVITGINAYGKTVVVEFGDVQKQDTGNGRCLSFSSSETSTGNGQGMVWHATGYWATYGFSGAWMDAADTNPNSIANSTVTFPFKPNAETFDILLNGEAWITGVVGSTLYKYLALGSSSSAFNKMTIRKLRIYEGA